MALENLIKTWDAMQSDPHPPQLLGKVLAFAIFYGSPYLGINLIQKNSAML